MGPKTQRMNKMEKNPDLVILIGSDAMGDGSKDLGQILIKSYLATLIDLPQTPDYLIFVNAGVYLTAKGTVVLEDLKELEGKGTKILSCGTCVNFFELGEPAAGTISNMTTISGLLASANHLISL